MDWDLKPPSWDLADLERDAEPNIGSIVGLSSLGGPKSKGDCSVDLKLGRLGDFADRPLDKWKDSRVLSMVSPPGSSKRARAPGNGSNTAMCLVDGCKSDLSNCRDYHKRHKVCEVHAKTPKVMVHGQEQRFCQQCSRFHSLVEFDEVKRSCRKRLDGHNRRRRKPQHDSLAVNSRTLFTNHQATRFTSCITTPQMLSTSMTEQQPNWIASIKSEDDSLYGCHPPMFLDKQHPFPTSYTHSYKGGKQFPFLQSVNDPSLSHRTTLETPGRHPLLSTVASSESSSSGSKMFSAANGITGLDSDCALSLLSSPTRTSGISLRHVVQATEPIPMAQPLVMGPQQFNSLGRYSCSQTSNSMSSTRFSCSGMEDEQMANVLVSSASDADLHQGIFHVAHAAENGQSASQTLPFW
ncbi:squamosa promoter-binding-like protein 18 [Magnolia sinica]|uniref:squamosa promoter-binding-like protein 18 n=1 Tax=Magnolia sinica TaxID=86752 RepID=UPI002658974F|nr:squamosa promoter-binding-like protein 18 [Magnolia sinica]XP_058093179.1 squamosa promoter-binding-like protein 18 [Magnolia sinica]XP_058093180.1 squamosa promoter-binding-like protein 18 [Magnolia sinica]